MDKKARFKDCGLAYLLCLVLVVGLSGVISAIIAIVASNEGVEVTTITDLPIVNYLDMFLSEFIFVLVFLIVVLLYKNKNYKTSYKLKFKFDIKIFSIVIFLGVFVMLCSLNLTNAVNQFFSIISPASFNSNLSIPLQSFWDFLIAVILLAVLPSVCEEIVFRGIIYNGLRQRFSFVASLFISAAMFMIMHLSIYKSFYQFILGVVLALLVYYTGTIFYSIIFHFTNNFVIIALNYAFGSRSPLEFSNFEVGEVLISILIFAVGFVFVFFIFKMLNKYANKHKNYFELDATSGPLENFEIDKTNATYEDKLLTNNKMVEGMGLLLVSITLMFIIWSFNSFGGFI